MVAMTDSLLTQAATDQGLDPMREHLTTEGIAFEVANTGGYCMLIEVPTAHGGLVGITRSEDEHTDQSPRQLVVCYADRDDVFDGDQHVCGSALDTEATLAALRARTAS